MKRTTVLQGAIIGIAGTCAAVPVDPAWVEQWFSVWWYPAVQRVVTPASNVVPFALFDVLVAGAGAGAGALVWRMARRAYGGGRLQRAARAILRVLTTGAAVYLIFLALWGWNYRRVAMLDRLEMTSASLSPGAVLSLAREAAVRLNGLYEAAHAGGWHEQPLRSGSLTSAFSAVQELLSDAAPAAPGRLKPTLLGPYFRWAGIDGMVNPFALEVLVNPDLLPFERPFVAAHEWAHLAGYAREAEASFVGWLTCLRGSQGEQYSGWLFLYGQIVDTLDAGGRAASAEWLGQGPRRDVAAVAERIRRGQRPVLRRASTAVYDRYLRANRVDEGIRSYDEVVSLILRTRFLDGWTPVRRQS